MLNDKGVSVITVVRNDIFNIEKTIKSVLAQKFESLQYIVVDGASTDGTRELIDGYGSSVDVFLSEEDRGIYDAMNKGVSFAKNEWIIFLHSGDFFASDTVLNDIFCLDVDCDIIYSDVYLSNDRLLSCNIDKNIINHQAIIYKKNLHEKFGLYHVKPGFSAADYFFFQLLKDQKWMKTISVISFFKEGGVSSSIDHFKQKIAIDILFNNINKYYGALIIMFHELYYRIKKVLKLFCKEII